MNDKLVKEILLFLSKIKVSFTIIILDDKIKIEIERSDESL